MLYGYIIILSLLLILISYSYGRKIGNKEGYYKGISEIPLSLKLSYLQTNECPICNKQQQSNKGGKG